MSQRQPAPNSLRSRTSPAGRSAGTCTREYFASGKMSKGQKRSTAYHPGVRAGRFVGRTLLLVHMRVRCNIWIAAFEATVY